MPEAIGTDADEQEIYRNLFTEFRKKNIKNCKLVTNAHSKSCLRVINVAYIVLRLSVRQGC